MQPVDVRFSSSTRDVLRDYVSRNQEVRTARAGEADTYAQDTKDLALALSESYGLGVRPGPFSELLRELYDEVKVFSEASFSEELREVVLGDLERFGRSIC